MNIITPGEIAAGLHVTVHHWKTDDHHKSRAHCGEPLLVRAVALPYIMLRQVGERGGGYPIQLDTREVELMELPKEYVEACL